MKRQWPNDESECVNFDELLEPAIDAIEQAYTLKATTPRAIRWSGLPLGQTEAASRIDFPRGVLELREEREREEGRGRDSAIDLRIILGHVVRTAIEQGRRLEAWCPSRDHRRCKGSK